MEFKIALLSIIQLYEIFLCNTSLIFYHVKILHFLCFYLGYVLKLLIFGLYYSTKAERISH